MEELEAQTNKVVEEKLAVIKSCMSLNVNEESLLTEVLGTVFLNGYNSGLKKAKRLIGLDK